MDTITLGLTIAGFIFGLIGVWPKLVSWAGSIRSAYSARANRTAEHRLLQFNLALQDPCYLVAYLFFNLALSAGLALIAYVLTHLTLEGGWDVVALAARLVVSLVAGSFLGNVIGISVVVMRRKQASSSGGG